MPIGQASTSTQIQLEGVQDLVAFLGEKESKLDGRIGDSGRAERVSARNYRVPMETALPGAWSLITLDDNTTAFPAGSFSQWDVGTVTPQPLCIPLEWTKEIELAADGGNRSVQNAVDRTLADAALSLKRARDILLQTDGTGNLGTIDSVSGTTYTLRGSTTTTIGGFGSRLIKKGQQIQVFNGNTQVGTANVLNVQDTLGASQTVVVDADPGAAGGHLIRAAGVATGSPAFWQGIPVFVSTSTSGTVMGIARSNPYVVACGFSASSGQITQPMVRLALNQIINRLGEDGIKGLLVHTHPSQIAAFEELGFNQTFVPLDGGKAGSYDPMFKNVGMAGLEIIRNIHADQTRIDFLNPKLWGYVKWGNGPFFFEWNGNRMFPVYNGGSITAAQRSYLVDARQYYCYNMVGQAGITSLKIPALN